MRMIVSVREERVGINLCKGYETPDVILLHSRSLWFARDMVALRGGVWKEESQARYI